jgi:hypothetical protein
LLVVVVVVVVVAVIVLRNPMVGRLDWAVGA